MTMRYMLPILSLAVTAGAVNVSVDPGKVLTEVPRTLYGTGMEDVNHEIYGGLDAQRLHDESFEETLPPQVHPHRPTGTGNKDCGRQWTDISADGGIFALADAPDAHLGRHSQLLMPGTGTAGVANRGLNGWGVPCREGKKMVGHVYAKGQVGTLEVMLQRQDGRLTYARQKVAQKGGDAWTKLDFELVPDTTDPAARFVLLASGGGRVWLDDAYLADEPTNDFGRMGCREDIVAAFQKEGLTFLRWGGSMVNAPEYLLKGMMAGDRRPYTGFWFRTSSMGFMVPKFVEMADRMKLPCAFSIHAYDTTEDAVALAEWLKRFDGFLCVQIGNEECAGFTPAGGKPKLPDVRRYCENLRRLVPAMRQANPKLVFANAMMWQEKHMDLMEETFRLTDGYTEFWDIHVPAAKEQDGRVTRASLAKFRDMIARLNPKSTMKAAIFEENAHIHDMRRALAHASILEAAREAGPFLLTSCPANALQAYAQNDNGWDQGQIFYTPDKAWLQPCGWAQRMASLNHRDLLVEGRTDATNVTVSATRDRAGASVVLHLCNVSPEPQPLEVSFAPTSLGAAPVPGAQSGGTSSLGAAPVPGAQSGGTSGLGAAPVPGAQSGGTSSLGAAPVPGAAGLKLVQATCLSAPTLETRNTPDDPDRVSPRDITESFRHTPTLPPYSYTVLEYRR